MGGLLRGLMGQRETRKHDKATERDLPLSQTGANIVLWTFAFLLLLANVLIIGPALGVTVVLVVGGYLTILIHLWSVGTRIEGWVLICGMFAAALWLWIGPDWIDSVWFVSRSTWRPIYKTTFATFTLPIVAIAGMNIWRFLYEVVDPNSPGPVGIRPAEWGILWPWKEPPREEPEIIVEQEQVVREVPRPVSTPQNGKANVIPEQPPDPRRVKRNFHKTILAPSDREVRVGDLVNFIRLAPTITPAFNSAWKHRNRVDGQPWDLKTWQDVVDVWALYGVVTKRENGKKTRVLVSDLNEAMGRLSSAFD